MISDIPRARGEFFNLIEIFFPQVSVGKRPFEVIDEDERFGFKLLRYGGSDGEKVLVVPSIVNRPYILDLNDDVSVIGSFCESFDVYMIDWGYPTVEDNKISFSDYIRYVDRAVDLISDEISILGYCIGGIISLMYASLYSEKVKNLILLATPIDFSMRYDPRISLGRIVDVVANQRFAYPKNRRFLRTRKIADLFGNIPGELINLFGRYMFFSYLPFFSVREEFIEEFLTYESWRDALRMYRWFLDAQMIPGLVYMEFIENCYKKNLLIKGEMKIDSKTIDLSKINAPLLNILAKYDHIIPIKSVKALKEVYSGDYEEIVFPSSHVGLSVSRKAHVELWPEVCRWLEERK
ncbi:MAG: acyl-CoA synthetase [Candidatus Methanolliviera sp. GoM_oil]|nr:MAG: acyl-CoA synthetase [Candidatus Methanolliviera sp. GoM_oil]